MELVFLALGEHHIGQDAQNQSAGDSSQSNFAVSAKGHAQTADAGDQDCGNHKQVLAGVQVDLLNHLQTGNGDEAVQSHADTAHNAVGDRGQEGDKGTEEGDYHAHNGGSSNGDHRCVTGNGNAADGLAVGGVGAAAEDSAGDGADAVT